MHQQDTSGTAAAGLLELVSPPAVEVLRLAAEGHGGSALAVAHQHHEDAAPDIQALVVVPAAVGGRDAVPHEHQGRVHSQGGLGSCRAHHQVCAQSRRQCLLRPLETEAAGGCVQPQVGEPDRLPVAGAVRGLEAQDLQLRLQVAHGQLPAPLARAPAFQHIVSQEGEVGPEGRFVDLGYLGQKRKTGEGDTDEDAHKSLQLLHLTQGD